VVLPTTSKPCHHPGNCAEARPIAVANLKLVLTFFDRFGVARNSAIICGCDCEKRITQGGCNYSVEVAMEGVPSFVVWLGSRVIPTCLAMALTVSMTERASAFDCLAYKPERVQGQWHADVVSGKICWYGPNWRSFLPRPKSRAENPHITNRKPVTQVVDRSPSEVEQRTDSVQVANDKTDAQFENGKPEISADSEPSTSETVDREKTEEASGIHEATPAEAAAFRNAVSLKFTPAPRKNSNPAGVSAQTNIRDLFIAMTVVVLGTVGLAALILKAGRREAEIEPDPEAERFEFMPVEADLAPPLQANSDDENQFVTSNLPEFLKRENVE
jgi:hypothetical protein